MSEKEEKEKEKEKEKTTTKKKIDRSNDFFNLQQQSSDDNDEDDEKAETERERKEKVSKWNWDDKKNFHLYYKFNNNYSDNNNKRRKSNDDDDESTNRSSSSSSTKKKLSSTENDVNGGVRVEVLNSDSDSNGVKMRLLGHHKSVNRINWSKRTLTRNLLLSSSFDGTIIIWNVAAASTAAAKSDSAMRIFRDVHTGSIRNAIWSNDESQIISVSYDKSCALTDVESGKLITRLNRGNENVYLFSAVASHPTDANLMLIGAKNEILQWDIRTSPSSSSPKRIYKSLIGQVQDLLFLNENEFVSAGDVVCQESAQYSLVVWDLKTAAILSDQIFHEKYVCTCLRKHPFSAKFYAQTHGNYLVEFASTRPYKMTKNKIFNAHTVDAYSIGFDLNASGNLIASGSADGCVYIYNTNGGQQHQQKLNAFNKEIITQPCMDAKFQQQTQTQTSSVERHHHQHRLAASCWNGLIKIIDF